MHALTGRRFLIAGGVASLALAALHVLVIAIGNVAVFRGDAPRYR